MWPRGNGGFIINGLGWGSLKLAKLVKDSGLISRLYVEKILSTLCVLIDDEARDEEGSFERSIEMKLDCKSVDVTAVMSRWNWGLPINLQD